MKRIAVYLFAVSALSVLTYCGDKKEKTPEPTPPSTPSVDLLAGSTFKTYKLSTVTSEGVDLTASPIFASVLTPCKKAYLYDFYADSRTYQRKGNPACAGDKDTLNVSTWKFNKTKDTLIIGAGLGKGKIKEMNSSGFTLVKDTLGFTNVEITLKKI